MGTNTSGSPSAIETVDDLIQSGIQSGASDLLFDPGTAGYRVRARRDGALHPVTELPAAIAARVVGRIKAMASLLVYRTDAPQDGTLTTTIRDGDPAHAHTIELRVATYPTPHGERVALRFPDRRGVPALAQLGLSPNSLDALQHALSQPDGVLLLTGPSGSGKTTTLYSCLQHLTQGPHLRSIVSIEDPIEQDLDGVVQTATDSSAGLTTALALRSLLRQDPDVLLIGEIRDRDTACTALEAGLTGHLVASTVHAGSAPLVFARLLDMGVEPFALTSVVRGVLAQRLIRRRCAEPDHPCTAQRTCRCEGTGLYGRGLLDHWLPMNSTLRQAILARADGDELCRAAQSDSRTNSPLTLRQLAAERVQNGWTTQQEVDRVLGRNR